MTIVGTPLNVLADLIDFTPCPHLPDTYRGALTMLTLNYAGTGAQKEINHIAFPNTGKGPLVAAITFAMDVYHERRQWNETSFKRKANLSGFTVHVEDMTREGLKGRFLSHGRPIDSIIPYTYFGEYRTFTSEERSRFPGYDGFACTADDEFTISTDGTFQVYDPIRDRLIFSGPTSLSSTDSGCIRPGFYCKVHPGDGLRPIA